MSDLGYVYSDTVYPYAPEVDRYVVAMIRKVGATSVEDMKAVMQAFAADGSKVPEWRLKGLSEEYLRGEWTPPAEIGAEAVETFLALYGREALVAEVDDEGSDDGSDPAASRSFGLPYMPAGEAWPCDGDGEPLRFVAQFNLGRHGYRLDAMPDTAMLLVFVPQGEDVDESGLTIVKGEAGQAYVLADPPEGYEVEPARTMAMRKVVSYPHPEDPFVTFPEGLDPEDPYRSDLGQRIEALRQDGTGTQVGGWPSLLQGPPYIDLRSDHLRPGQTSFLFQLCDDTGLEYGDTGYIHVYGEPEGGEPGELVLKAEMQIC